MSITAVNIEGIDRDELLYRLWKNAKPALFFICSGLPSPEFDLKEAKEGALNDGYVDYACGRCIKAALYRDSNIIDPSLYDRECGQGAFQRVVNQLKEKK